MKKYFILLLCILLAIFMFGCSRNGGNSDNTDNMDTASPTVGTEPEGITHGIPATDSPATVDLGTEVPVTEIPTAEERTPVEAPTPESLVLDDDLALGELKVNMTRQEIDGLMKAKLTKSAEDSSYGIQTEILSYDDGTEIHLVEGKLYSVRVTSAIYPSPRGLKIGDAEDTVKQLYGVPTAVENGRWIYSSKSGYDLFFVTVEDGMVVQIMVSQVM